MNRFFAPLLLGFALLTGCVATQPRPGSTTAAAIAPTPSVAPDDSLYATLWQQTALEHDLVYQEVYRDARQTLLRALHNRRWDALPREERRAEHHGKLRGLKPAVILDVDETVLDNSPYQARLVRAGKEFEPTSWTAWCKEGVAKPLPGALAFTRFAATHGIAVFYVSNRAQDLNRATLDNLRKAGFPVSGDDAFLGAGMTIEGCEQAGSGKGCRRRLVARKYRVLMQFGDQLGDFVDLGSNTPQARRDAVAPYREWIGERWFVLPNPVYGSWQTAALHGHPAPTQDARRALEHQALRVQ